VRATAAQPEPIVTNSERIAPAATQYNKNVGGGFSGLLKTAIFVGITAGAGYGGYTMGFYDQEGKFKKPTLWTTVTAEESAPTALNPEDFVPFKLVQKFNVTHDTKLFRFALPSPEHKLGLHPASCILTRAQGPDGKPIVRPYTPVSKENVQGHFDLIIKVYPDGPMSTHIDRLKPGDSLEVKGPISKFQYTPNMKKEIGMLAGGTGITPMLQLLYTILENPADKTRIHLVFCNKTVQDILVKESLDMLVGKYPNRFRVYYMVDKAPERTTGYWGGGVGFITKEAIKANMPAPSDNNLILVCGPTGFYKTVSGDKTPEREQGPLTGLLQELGYKESQVFKF